MGVVENIILIMMMINTINEQCKQVPRQVEVQVPEQVELFIIIIIVKIIVIIIMKFIVIII